MDEAPPTHRSLIGWFLILVLGGPLILILAYSFIYAIMPNGNPSQVLLPLLLYASLVIAVAFVVAFVSQARRRRRKVPPGGTPTEGDG